MRGYRYGRLRGRARNFRIARARRSVKRRRSQKGGRSRRNFRPRFRAFRRTARARKQRFIKRRSSRYGRGRLSILSRLAGLRAKNPLWQIGQRHVTPKLAHQIFSVLDSRIPPVDYRRQGWGILDSGMGSQTMYWSSGSSTNSPTGYLFAPPQLALLAGMTDAGEAIAGGQYINTLGQPIPARRFQIMMIRQTVTIYNPNTGPVYLRIELFTPRTDLTQGFQTTADGCLNENPRWEPNFIGATLADVPYMTDRWRLARKTKVVKIPPGATINYSWRDVKRPISVNIASGRFSISRAGEPQYNAWKGLTHVPVFTIRGPPALNGMNTYSEVAEGSYVGARLFFTTRQRIVWRPQFFSGASDISMPVFNYEDQFPDAFADDGAPIVSSFNTVKIFDDDDITPAGGNMPASVGATPDKRVWTHNT